jgi:hypothetical protein
LEHEIGRKTVQIALNCSVEVSRRHAIKLREVRVQNDLFVPKVVDERGDFFRNEETAGGEGFGAAGVFFFAGMGSGGGGGGEDLGE